VGLIPSGEIQETVAKVSHALARRTDQEFMMNIKKAKLDPEKMLKMKEPPGMFMKTKGN